MNEEIANAVADALEAHNHEDWYLALLHAALEDIKGDTLEDVEAAIAHADATYESNPTSPVA